ncbi:MAG: TIGR00266 family protein [Ilumatobacter sp.]|uniref:TIGR00266 family protein n=1 Tax=Ilumatobacter sp. TaxID=1967498 RepID=UPI00260F5CD0|nr:TIGR00266 family protein [Ilumatobacter sp.]MDJ0770454.1 TIGR00266 family protein [Ilumatobacter sp.]
MEIATRHAPAYGVARLSLGAGEQVRAEGGAMMAMSTGVELAAKAEGGVMRSLKRAALGGESFFISTYTAPAQGGFVDVAARLPGDITSYTVNTHGALFVSKGSWIASEASVEINTQWGGFKNMFGSEGAFILRAEGQGQIVFACYGALEVWELQAGQHITVDTGHMVAYEESVQMNLRRATGGLVQSFKSGEGLVFDFEGPGKVWTQTRNPNELLGWISATLGSGSGSGPGEGVLGGIFGRG